ncbi:hypothetical protein [Geminisphaera colitermitum]|uniref:hypothetical protein n=1 Tax=Geminisphaera colitermitum TaxID=1148786 RepID=UPI0012FF26D8|nr:hypothetical protein [Geminisphaera colitermitum]
MKLASPNVNSMSASPPPTMKAHVVPDQLLTGCDTAANAACSGFSCDALEEAPSFATDATASAEPLAETSRCVEELDVEMSPDQPPFTILGEKIIVPELLVGPTVVFDARLLLPAMSSQLIALTTFENEHGPDNGQNHATSGGGDFPDGVARLCFRPGATSGIANGSGSGCGLFCQLLRGGGLGLRFRQLFGHFRLAVSGSHFFAAVEKSPDKISKVHVCFSSLTRAIFRERRGCYVVVVLDRMIPVSKVSSCLEAIRSGS